MILDYIEHYCREGPVLTVARGETGAHSSFSSFIPQQGVNTFVHLCIFCVIRGIFPRYHTEHGNHEMIPFKLNC